MLVKLSLETASSSKLPSREIRVLENLLRDIVGVIVQKFNINNWSECTFHLSRYTKHTREVIKLKKPHFFFLEGYIYFQAVYIQTYHDMSSNTNTGNVTKYVSL